MELKGKIAIVTGASSGIGLATAKLLSKQGAKVVLASRSKDILDKLSTQLPDSFVVICDMTKISDIKNLIAQTKKKYGKIDILVNNAGQGYYAPILNIDATKFHDLFTLNLMGPLIAMQEVIPIMKLHGGGSIVNISSGTALSFLPNMAAYSSLKRALVGLSLTAREELKEDKILVSVVYPYITATDFQKNSLRDLSKQMGGNFPAEPDTAEHVAEKIIEAIETGNPEVFAHKWMDRSEKDG